ncbi:MAG: ACT domain-containing protein [Deinococcota bacterium]
MRLKLLDTVFAVCKFPPRTKIPIWALHAELFFIARTSDELSIMCPSSSIPPGLELIEVERSDGWRCFRVDGDLEFEQVGVVATVSAPIAKAGMSLFLVSTHDRDYVLVHQDNLERAVDIYKKYGFSVELSM